MAALAAVRNIGIGVVARGWFQVIALVLALLAARILGKQEFGIYAIANVFIILLQGMMYSGVYDYIIKNNSADLDVDTCFWMNFAFALLGGAAIAILAPLVSSLTHSPKVLGLMLALAPSALLASLSGWQEALLLREGRMKAYYGRGVVTESIACVIGVLSLEGGLGVWSFIVYRYSQLILASLSYLVIMRRLPRLAWRQATARTVFGFSGNIYVSRIIGTVSNYAADLLIGLLVNPASAGAYRLGSRIVLGVSDIAFQPVYTVAWVHFARAGSDDEALRREWLTFVAVLSLTAWPALAGLALLSRSVVQLVVGPGWDEAAPVVVILAASRMIAIFEVFLDPLLGVRDRSVWIFRLRAAASVMTVAILTLLARYGASSAAASQMVVAVFLAGCSLYVGLRTTKADPGALFRILLPGIVGTSLMLIAASCAGLSAAWSATPLLHIASAMVAGIFAWALVLLVLFRRRLFDSASGIRKSALP